MPSQLELSLIDSVLASICFGVDTGDVPMTMVHEPGIDDEQHLGRFERQAVTIHDARPLADRFSVDVQGFSIARHRTSTVNFYDTAEVREIYYPEMETLVKQATGAVKAIVFDHTIRVDDGGLQRDRKVRPPVRAVHNDFTIAAAEQRVHDLLPKAEARERLARRFGSINVWRPISGPVETAPLAICEYASIRKGDLIAAERRYQERVGGIYYLAYHPDQRWYYFPKMTRDEIVLLKCYDSLTDGTARWTAHGAFDDPDTPQGAAPRESIEMRTLVFYE